MTALREVFAHFGFTWDKSGVAGANAGVDRLAAGLGALSAVVAGSALVSGVREFANQLDVFDDLSDQTGIATDQLQLFGYAAKVSGSSAEEMFASLTLLQKSLGKTTEATGAQAEALTSLGIKTRDALGEPRKVADVLPEIFNQFSTLTSEAKQAEVATALFGRGGIKMLPTLRRGKEGLAELQAQFESFGGPVSAETIAAAGKLNDMFVGLNTAMFALKGTLASAILPRLTDMIGGLAKAVGKMSAFVSGTTLAETSAAALALTIGGKLFSALKPFLGAGLKFAAIYLAFDELLGFLSGKDSLIGDALDAAFGYGTARAVRDWVNDAIGQLGFLKGSVERDAAILAGTVQAGWLDKVRIGLGIMILDFATGGELIKLGMLSAFISIANGFDEMVLALSQGWNKLFGELGNGAFKIDTTGREKQIAGNAETQAGLDARLQVERKRLEGMHLAARQTGANAAAAAPGVASSVDVTRPAAASAAIVIPEITVQSAPPVGNTTVNVYGADKNLAANVAGEVDRVQKKNLRNAQAALVATR